MIGEECVHEFFQRLESRGQGLNSQGQDQGLQNCPRGWGLVLEDSNTAWDLLMVSPALTTAQPSHTLIYMIHRILRNTEYTST